MYTTMEELRIDRDALLVECDLALVDDRFKDTQIVLINLYKQILRDIPSLYDAETVNTAVIPNIADREIGFRFKQSYTE